MHSHSRLMSRLLIVPLIVVVICLDACGNSSDDNNNSEEPATSDNPSSNARKRVAYLAAARGNAFVDPSIAVIEEVAEQEGVEITIFDAQFDPQKQLAQCQDAVTQGFDAIVALPSAGVALRPCAAEAGRAKIPFVATNLPLGTSTTSGEPEADGVTSQVLTPMATYATEIIDQIVMACGDIVPCKVVYLGTALLLPQLETAFQNEISAMQDEHPNINVTSVDAGADRAGGLQAMQDALQRVPDPTVVTSPNAEPAEGAVLALIEAGLTPGEDVFIVTNGGTKTQITNITSGRYFSTCTALPKSEARIALEYALAAAAGEAVPTWSDAHDVDNLPYIINSDNANDFIPQW